MNNPLNDLYLFNKYIKFVTDVFLFNTLSGYTIKEYKDYSFQRKLKVDILMEIKKNTDILQQDLQPLENRIREIVDEKWALVFWLRPLINQLGENKTKSNDQLYSENILIAKGLIEDTRVREKVEEDKLPLYDLKQFIEPKEIN